MPCGHLFGALFHWHREFDRTVLVRFWGKHDAARLQIAPVQRAIDAVEGENDASFRPFDPNLHETLEKRGILPGIQSIISRLLLEIEASPRVQREPDQARPT